MQVVKGRYDRLLELFRGDSGAGATEIVTVGVRSKDPSVAAALLAGNWPSVLPEVGRIVAGHLLDCDPMPAGSFTTKHNRAKDYALRYGQNPEGIIARVNVHFVHVVRWTSLRGIHSRIYQDDRLRFWIHVVEIHPLDIEEAEVEYIKRSDQEAFFYGGDAGVAHRRGDRDDEYLLIGDVPRGEIRIEVASVRR